MLDAWVREEKLRQVKGVYFNCNPPALLRKKAVKTVYPPKRKIILRVVSPTSTQQERKGNMYYLRFLLVVSAIFSTADGTPSQIVRAKTTENKCAIKYTQFPGHTACLSASLKAGLYVLSDEDKQALVDQHNQLRGKVSPAATNMLKMSWDDEVAMLAQKWTESCQAFANKKLQHDKNSQRFIPGRFSVGQNLAVGYHTFADAIDAWFAEEKDYSYGVQYSKINAMVGHYTQMVWAESYKLGCAKTMCYGQMVYACNYSPAGNVGNFKAPYEAGARSQCKKVENNLCDCGSLECVNGSPMDLTDCSCSCTKKYSLGSDCKLKCNYTDPPYCGSHTNFMKKDCYGVYTVSVTQKCLHMCKVCPYALEDDNDNDDDDDDDGGDGAASQIVISTMTLTLVAAQSIYHFTEMIL